MAKRKGKPTSGGARLKAAGKRAILLGVDQNAWLCLKRAADAEHRPLTQFILHYALNAAELANSVQTVKELVATKSRNGPKVGLNP